MRYFLNEHVIAVFVGTQSQDLLRNRLVSFRITAPPFPNFKLFDFGGMGNCFNTQHSHIKDFWILQDLRRLVEHLHRAGDTFRRTNLSEKSVQNILLEDNPYIHGGAGLLYVDFIEEIMSSEHSGADFSRPWAYTCQTENGYQIIEPVGKEQHIEIVV